MPRVTVLLPVRDARPTLADCLHSLTAQTLEDHEVVAVDDGSRDGSAELLEAYARADGRLRVVRTEARGLVTALNTALAHARAPLVARMDADDLAHSERLARQAEWLSADPGVDVLGCRVRLLAEEDALNRGMRAYVGWLNALLDHEAITRDLFVESPLAHPSVMMRTAALRALGGYRAFDGPEDYDLWLRAHTAGLRFGKLAKTLLLWRDGAGRLSRTDPRYAPDRFLDLKLHALARGPLAGHRPVVIWGAGPVGKGWSRALARHGHPVAAFVEVDPRKIGGSIHGAPVVPVAGAAAFRGPLHLAAVGQAKARDRIREEAHRLGLCEGRDLLAVA
jgi:glycosyltransferase involved in cell wall biosynthesis